MKKLLERLVSAAETTNYTCPDISSFNMKDFVGSLTAVHRERAVSPTFKDWGITSWYEDHIFKIGNFGYTPGPLQAACSGADQHCLWASKAQLKHQIYRETFTPEKKVRHKNVSVVFPL